MVKLLPRRTDRSDSSGVMNTARTRVEVEAYLHAHIPISSAMGVRVNSCSMDGVVLGAPLAPNLNHRATVFGGSASAVAILSAWTWLHSALRDLGLNCRVVIQRNQMEYLVPIEADFTAHCAGLPNDEWQKCQRTLKRHEKARVSLDAWLQVDTKKVAQFSGDYVVVLISPTGGTD